MQILFDYYSFWSDLYSTILSKVELELECASWNSNPERYLILMSYKIVVTVLASLSRWLAYLLPPWQEASLIMHTYLVVFYFRLNAPQVIKKSSNKDVWTVKSKLDDFESHDLFCYFLKLRYLLFHSCIYLLKLFSWEKLLWHIHFWQPCLNQL